MFLAALIPQTKNILLGTAVINLPNHHPAIVAAEAAQFDHMSGGRFMLGVGSGGLAPDFELFDGAVRQRKFLESIDLILKIWAQDPPYDLQGEFWKIQIKKVIVPELGFGGMPKPLQKPHPPVRVSIGSPNSEMARMAAGVGRLMTAWILPTILWIQTGYGLTTVFVCIAIVLLIAAYSVTKLGPEAKQLGLDEIAAPTG